MVVQYVDCICMIYDILQYISSMVLVNFIAIIKIYTYLYIYIYTYYIAVLDTLILSEAAFLGAFSGGQHAHQLGNGWSITLHLEYKYNNLFAKGTIEVHFFDLSSRFAFVAFKNIETIDINRLQSQDSRALDFMLRFMLPWV